jgi:ParB family chromosome partitioning protein
MNMDEKESGIAAMVENLQRQDLDFLEEARGIANLMEKWNFTQDQAARILGKSQSSVANKLRLLRHSEPVLTAIRQGNLTERHARALLRLPSEEDKLEVIEQIVRQGMSVSRAESYIEQRLMERPLQPVKPSIHVFLNHLTHSLARIQLSGIPAVSERRETDSQIVLTITIPK